MKKIYFSRIVAAMVLLLMIVNTLNAQNAVFNTVTGQATGVSAGTGVVLPAVSVSGGNVVNVNNGWNGYYVFSIGADGTDYYAQSFIADVANIRKIGIVIQELSAEGQVRFGIAADNGGVPNYASPLYMGSIINPTTTAKWYYEKGLNVPVTIGEKYYILIDGYDIAGTSGRAQIGSSATSPYNDEGIIYSNDGGGSWDTSLSSAYPLAIYVEGNAGAVPVPTWAIALAFVVIGVTTFIGIRRKMVKQAI